MAAPTATEYKDYRDLLASIGVAFPYPDALDPTKPNGVADVTLDFKDIINNSPDINSSGWFKEMMDSINGYIREEYQADRITGNDYANVYLGSIKDAVAACVGFALQEAITKLKIETEKENLELILSQRKKIDFEIGRGQQLLPHEVTAAKNAALKSEQDLVTGKLNQRLLEKQLLLADETFKAAELNNSLLVAKYDKQVKDTSLVNSKLTTESKQQLILDRQAAKALQDTDLVVKKIATEQSQKLVLDSQASLYGTQAVAFKAKHKLAIADMYVKSYTIFMGQNPLTPPFFGKFKGDEAAHFGAKTADGKGPTAAANGYPVDGSPARETLKAVLEADSLDWPTK